MIVKLKGKRQALTTHTNIPIAGRLEYVYEFEDDFSAKYCEGKFLASVRGFGAELYQNGNELVLGTFGANDDLARFLLKNIEEVPYPL